MSIHEPFVLLIDGRAGSGKTTLAAGLALRHSATVVHMDDLTPGWYGLSAATDQLVRMLETGTAQRYDWVTQAPAEQILVDRSQSLIVEGCGSITERTLALATRSLWIDCDDALRQQRALARDGEMFAEYWNEWAEQEETHMHVNQPEKLASFRYRGDSLESEQDKLAECSKLLFSSQEVEATSEHYSKLNGREHSTPKSSQLGLITKPQV